MWRARKFYRGEELSIGTAILLLLLSIAANLLKPWPMALIVDCLLGSKPLPSWVSDTFRAWPASNQLAALALSTLVLHAIQSVLGALQNNLAIRIGLRGLARMRQALFDKLQSLSLRYYQLRNQGDLIYRATWDTYAVQTLFQQGVVTFLSALLTLGVMLGVMLKMSLTLTLVGVALMPLLLLVMAWFSARMKQRSLLSHSAESAVSTSVQQSISNIALTQSYTREKFESARFGQLVAQAFKVRAEQHRFEVVYWLVVGLIFGLGTAAVVWFGGRQVLWGQITTGQLLVFLAYLAQWYEPLNQLSHVSATTSDASAGLHRVMEVLESNESVDEPAHPKSTPAVRGDLRFENVSFGFDASRKVVDSLSFSLKAGSTLALIGPSGAGKTTLLHLVPRFYDPSSGRVLLDETELKEWSVAELRQHVAVVMQEPVLMPGTIADNIAYGKPGATTAEIEDAARSAHAHEFILRQPNGYGTVVGDGAGRLSVGERQRINLARAFLKNAPILLLDEPTSALDGESERLVVESIERLMVGRTVIMVAHRLSTIRGVDHIMVLDQGCIVQQGTHDELMAMDGFYRRIQTNKPTSPATQGSEVE